MSNNQEKRIVAEGLRPLPEDARDFQFGAVNRLPDLSELPDFFRHATVTYDQGNSDLCTAYMSCGMSALQESKELQPEFSFMASKILSGNPFEWGQDLRTACKTHVKYGALAREDMDPILLDRNPEQLRLRESWRDDLFEKAKKHKKKSYWSLSGPYDAFDNARATMWKLQEERVVVGFGVNWGYGSSDVFLKEITKGVGHAVYTYGWNKIDGEMYLIVQNSLGTDYGEHGRHYISREVFNHFVEKYGSYLFTDEPVEEARSRVKYGVYDTDCLFARMIKYIKHYV